MGDFKEVLDTIKDAKGELASIGVMTPTKSISSASSDGILNFPAIVSNALTIEDAALVSKALEREYASFVLVVMTMNPYLNVKNGREASAANYINKFHQNIDRTFDVSSYNLSSDTESMAIEASSRLGIDDYKTIKGLEETLCYRIYEGVNSRGVNAQNIKFNFSLEDVTESSILNDQFNHRVSSTDRITLEADNEGRREFHSPIRNDDKVDHSARQLVHMMDNDSKKANELVPTLLHMRIFPVSSVDNKEMEPIDFVLGIKVTLHPISSDEIILNICRGVKNENKFFNFLRWTTGEIKFFKDFLFGINEMKIDALNSGSGATKWWAMLKRRKAAAKVLNVISKDKMLPNATIIVTQDEVNTIKELYGYDFNETSIITKLMKSYFLIGFVVVDPALQRVKFLFDGKTQFETLTYATLAKESTTNDKQFKEMLNMLGRRI